MQSLIGMAAANGATSLELPFTLLEHLQPETIKGLVTEHGQLLHDSLPAALTQLAGAYSRPKPEEAVEILNSMTDGLAKDEAAVGIVGAWAQSDPAAAANWASTLAQGKAQEVAYRNVANSWARVDPAGAQSWIDEMKPSPGRDAATGEFEFFADIPV
jgi:hypothetical protein